MPPILNANAILTCPHGGLFKVLPLTAPTVIVGGAPVVTMMDMAVPESPCPFVTPAGVPLPCVEAKPLGPPAGTVTAMGVPVLLETTQFLTTGTGPPVPAEVTFPGQVLVEGM
jgi:hypothetical protein